MGFDEGSLKDIISNNSAEQVNGNKLTTDRFGRKNQAIELNGIGQNEQSIKLGLNDFRNLDVNTLTITAWIKLRDKGFIILDNRAEWHYQQQGYHLQINDIGQLVLMAHDDSSFACFPFPYDDSCTVDSKDGRVPQKVWTHVAVTKNKQKVQFYIDGKLYNANNDLPSEYIQYNYEASRRNIGTADDKLSWDYVYRSGSTRYSKGSIDDLRVYERALSQNEIQLIKKYKPPHSCINTLPESQVCTSCRENRILKGIKCLCITGLYEVNLSSDSGQEVTCVKCPKLCATCNDDISCTSCVASVPQRIGPNCECPDNFFDNGIDNQCQQCEPQCKICKYTANNCIVCKKGYYMI